MPLFLGLSPTTSTFWTKNRKETGDIFHVLGAFFFSLNDTTITFMAGEKEIKPLCISCSEHPTSTLPNTLTFLLEGIQPFLSFQKRRKQRHFCVFRFFPKDNGLNSDVPGEFGKQ